MLTFHHTCIGSSHLASGKPCQDASYCETSDRMSIAIVSDGHGGANHSRSDIGSQMALRAARYVIDNNPLTSWGDPYIRPALFDEIVRSWRDLVTEHYNMIRALDEIDNTPLFEDVTLENSQEINILYGCTLMVACVHPNGWFAFQIGDGKCVTIHPLQTDLDFTENTSKFLIPNSKFVTEPIPADDRCFLNVTTSLCDLDAATEFRFCGGDKDTMPVAIFLGSDGIDTSWGSKELLHDFYLEILKHCSSRETILQELREVLPKLSEKGSHDDMSIAALVRDEVLPELISIIFQYQIAECERIKKRQEIRLVGCQEAIALKQAELAERPNDEFLQRDLSNLQNHLSQVNQLLARSTSRLALLQQQLTEYQQQTSKNNIETSS